jgi:hypothetical protein
VEGLSGRIPFVRIEEELPEHVPLPTEEDEVVPETIPFKVTNG